MQKRVRDVMTREVVCVDAGTPFKDVAKVLVEHRVSAVPVLDGEGHVVGVVSEADLLRKEEVKERSSRDDHRPALRAGPRERVTGQSARLPEKARAGTAAELMTSPAIVIRSSGSVVSAARAMRRFEVKRLPVVDEEGRPEGIVSRHDLLNVFVRSDDAIAAEIRDDILEGPLWTDTSGVHLSVADGVVTLSGHIAHRDDARIIARMIGRVDGVVDVVDKLVGTARAAADPHGERI
ncbi:CBS domain-containing protein [Sphaerisporangium sp. B11E5]|uniref:CBS domain-containing protein n=1 Tax=Sphaerisporangium sp. B11E5 TaxID=3153563 RepID=UPI00325C85E1